MSHRHLKFNVSAAEQFVSIQNVSSQTRVFPVSVSGIVFHLQTQIRDSHPGLLLLPKLLHPIHTATHADVPQGPIFLHLHSYLLRLCHNLSPIWSIPSHSCSFLIRFLHHVKNILLKHDLDHHITCFKLLSGFLFI